MRIFALLIVIFGFLPAVATEKQTSIFEYSSKLKHKRFNKKRYKKSKKRKINYGDKVEYIVDYSPDDHDHHSSKGILFHDDDGEFYQLDEDAIVISKRKAKAKLIGNTAADATGNKRTLVIAVADPVANKTSKIYSRSFLQSSYFNQTGPSLRNYYREVSSNKVSFSGVVDERLFVVNNLCEGGNIFRSGASDALIGIVDKEIDLSVYDRLSFVFPEDSNCLAGALGVATLGTIEFTNSFGKDTKIGVNFNISAGVNVGNDIYFLKVVAHEFGHNFGLQHDNASACGEEIFQNDCNSLAYGGVHSIMGFSPNLAHVNAIHQLDLKWLTSSQVVTIDEENTRTELTLKALAADTDSGVKAIKIRRNDGSYYFIEYRSQLGIENYEFAVNQLSYGGVQIYFNNEANANVPKRSDSALLRTDLQSFSINDNSQYRSLLSNTSFTPDHIFYDPVSDIRVTTISVNTQEARVLVEKAFVDGGGIVEVADPYVEQISQIDLKDKGITKVKSQISYEADTLANAKISIKIPKAYRKLIQVKKKSFNLSSNLADVKFKVASRKKLAKKLDLNDDGFYSIPIKAKIYNKDLGVVVYQGGFDLLLRP